MTAKVIIVPGAMPSRDANGRSLPAIFRFYLPGTTTPTTVYTDNTLSVPLPFPLFSDSAGRWPAIWADDSLFFDLGWSDLATDTTIKTFTGITTADDAVLASVAMAQADADLAAASADDAALSAAQAAASAAAAAAAGSGAVLTATSSATRTIGPGSFTFPLDQTGTDFVIGMDVQASDILNPANRIVGTVTAFSDPNLTFLVPSGSFTGSGAHSAWSISITAIGGVQSVAGLTGMVGATDLATAIDVEGIAAAMALVL